MNKPLRTIHIGQQGAITDTAGELGPTPDGAEPVKPTYPKPIRQVVNYSTAMARWIKAGKPRRTAEEQQRIKSICQACPIYDATQDRCRACGCYLSSGNVAGKIEMATESCPKGHW